MHGNERIGIIDIGSNSIRLVIYEQTAEGAHRVIDESKESARLSERIGSDGALPEEDIVSIVDTLLYFKMICEANHTQSIRAVATAAVRNASNSEQIVEMWEQRTQLKVEIIPGKEEARLGFLGVINSIDIAEGFIVDIGGGSTEITYFKDRTVVESVSLPFGAVNTTARFVSGDHIDKEEALRIERMVKTAVDELPWLSKQNGLPLIGLGGTIRTVSKMDQKRKKYSLELTHNYRMSEDDVKSLLRDLIDLSEEKRKKVDGLSKDRADIIVPGMLILNTIFKTCGASHYVVSGTGIRDGLYYETLHPDKPVLDQVLDSSVTNLLLLHPAVSVKHVNQVQYLALQLFRELQEHYPFDECAEKYLRVSALLYRIGITVNYYDFRKHTYYLMAHSRIDGLTHREILVCALIASYKTKSRTRQKVLLHKDILTEADFRLIIQLGTLLRLAEALDRSQTQPVADMTVRLTRRDLLIQLVCRHGFAIELREAEMVEFEFRKVWGLRLRIRSSESAESGR